MVERPPPSSPAWPEEPALVSWRSWLARVLAWLDVSVGRTKRWIRSALDLHQPAGIVPYRGFGTPRRLALRGRVLEGSDLPVLVRDDGSLWAGLKRAFLRYHTTEVAGARVRATWRNRSAVGETDEDGYFEVAFDLPAGEAPGGDRLWHEVGLELLRPLRPGQAERGATGRVLVPPARARFLVVSDVDDTIVVTGANRLLRSWRTQLIGSARARTPLPGMAAFYRALHAGADGEAANPIFYLSSSPWNLYDLLEAFLEHHGFPLGPLLLTDYGFDRGKLVRRPHRAHKLDHLRLLLETYPDLRVLLVGDSGQADAEIYADVARVCPDRVLAIYIRDVVGERRDRHLEAIADRVRDVGVEFVRARDTQTLVDHARGHGWLDGGAGAGR